MKFRSITFQLTLWYAGVLIMILLILGGLTYFKLSANLLNTVDETLKSESSEVANSAQIKDGKIQIYKDIYDNKGIGTRVEYFQILSFQGEIVHKSESLKQFTLPVENAQLQSVLHDKYTMLTSTVGDVPIRMIIRPLKLGSEPTYFLQMGISIEEIKRASTNLMWNFLIFFPIGVMLATFGGMFLAKRFLKPIDKIIHDANSIEAESLGFHIQPGKVKDEIGRLIDTLNKLFERLNYSFQRIRQFTADASHELSTPLTIMRGEAEVALKSSRRPDEYRHVIETNLDEIERMSRIVDNLLALTSMDSGEVQLSLEDVFLDDLMRDVHEQGTILAEDKNIDITLDSTQHISVKGDKHRLHQLFLNLVDNAIKYTPSGGKIWLAMQPGDNGVSISVTDTGVGINKSHLDKIFDRFYRVDKGRSREHGGSGLGLSIVRSIVELHKGKVNVESEPGGGSTFKVWLPWGK